MAIFVTILLLCLGAVLASPAPKDSYLTISARIAEPTLPATETPVASKEPDKFDEFGCDETRTRKDIRDMSREDVEKFHDAVLKMKADKGSSGLSEWDRMVRMHNDYFDEAHGGCYFLPWHRLYLLKLENHLRKYVSDVVLPIWDWTKDSNDPALSKVWEPENMGGARRTWQPIPDGPFQNFPRVVPSVGRVRRNFNSLVSGGMSEVPSMSAIENALGEPTWAEFSRTLEAAHAYPHIAVGGDMVTAYSPNDPIFFLHHGFIDFIYSMRQDAREENEFGGQEFGRTCSPDDILQAFGLPVRRGFSLDCVKYSPTETGGVNEEPSSGASPRGGSASDGSAHEGRARRGHSRRESFKRPRKLPNICNDPRKLRLTQLTKAQCEKAFKVLNGAA